jgi:LAO/AO transport system kinase
MASRGSLGGLANATTGVVQAFDAAGYHTIIIETVGAGQAEVDIASLAHTTLVIEAPGLGDDIQAIKAGILEIADIIIVNKADRPGVEITERALRGMLSLAHPVKRVYLHHGQRETIAPQLQGNQDENPIWIPPIQRTIATKGDGIQELRALIAEHRGHLEASGELGHRERTRLEVELRFLLQETLMNRWSNDIQADVYQSVLDEVFARELSPWQAVQILLTGGNV